MPLNGGDRQDAMMRIAQIPSRLLGLHSTSAMHQHACNNLKAVGDPVLHFLKKDRLLANEIIVFPSFGADERDVCYRQQEPDPVASTLVIEFARVQQQTTWAVACPDEVDLISLDLRAPRRGRPQQRAELRQGPFA